MGSILFKIVRIWHAQFKCTYLKNKKPFLNFLFHFWNLHQILNILKQNMIVMANILPKLQAVKNLLRPLPKRRRFRTHIDRQHVKACQIPAKAPWERFDHVFSFFSGKLIWKISPLVLSEILGFFVNTLTADAKCPVEDCKNLLLPIKMQLYEKPKAFSQLFLPILEFISSFKHFEKKDDCHS